MASLQITHVLSKEFSRTFTGRYWVERYMLVVGINQRRIQDMIQGIQLMGQQ